MKSAVVCKERPKTPVMIFATLASVVEDITKKIKKSSTARYILKLAGKVLLILAVVTLYTALVCHWQASKDAAKYAEQFEQYRLQLVQKAAQEAAERQEDPYVVQLRTEAELLAKILYGVKDNNENDLRTYAWCVFNRVDNPNFPNTFEEVADQPTQWMRYSADNPIVENLYKIALEEVTIWHEGHRPVSDEYVYMNWSPTKIKLRDRWEEDSRTEYWRYGQSE